LDHNQFDYEIQFTQAPKHAFTLAKEAKEKGIEIVAVVGGDGTVNEVASALLHSNVQLGILPGGSGNGFAMHLGMGRNIPKAIALLNNSKPLLIDTCELNGRPYFNVAGTGFDSLVAHRLENQKLRGFLGYFKASVSEGWKYKNKVYQVCIDDKTCTEAKFFSINVANASMFGYNFKIAPKAKLQDGLLDLVMIKDASKIRYIINLYRFITGSLGDSPFVEIINCKSVKISVEKPAYIHLDGEGERTEKEELHFKLIPSSLEVLVPNHMLNKHTQVIS